MEKLDLLEPLEPVHRGCSSIIFSGYKLMSRYAVAVLACFPVLAGEFKVDHVTVAGRDLGAMRRALGAAGLPTENGGPHSNHATEMALLSFPDGSYLELIAIQQQADPAAGAGHAWRKFLEDDGGPCAWAVRPADMAAEVQRLHAEQPIKNGRRRPDGVQLEWETAQVGPGNGTFFPFLIHDFTERDLRAYPSGKPLVTNFTGIAKVVLAVNDLDAAAKQFQIAYGLPAPQRQEDKALEATLASFAGTPVILATPSTKKSWLTERLQRFGEAPCAFVLRRAKVSKQITWLDSGKLGWHLGLE